MQSSIESSLAVPYLAAVPGVPRAEPFLSELHPFMLFLALDMGGTILAAFADEKRPRLADPNLIVIRSAVLAVFILARKPYHIVC